MNKYSNVPNYPDNISNQSIEDNNFITILSSILNKFLSMHKNDREEADISTEHLINFQFTSFLIGLSQIISDEKFSKEIRQLAVFVIKNKILNKNGMGEKKHIQKFLELDDLTKNNFKKNIIATLSSNNPQVRRAISTLIAAIYKTELSHSSEWTEAIENLVFVASNEKNENIFIESSLETLSFIIEEVGEKDFEGKLPLSIVDQALNCLFKNIEFSISANNLSRLIFCFSCLNRIIPYADSNLKNDQERDFIMKTIFEIGEKILIQVNFSENNFELLTEIILKSLIQICSYYYFFISDYFSEIYKLCSRVINSAYSERIILFALEILCVIGDKEIEVSNSFISHSISTTTMNQPKKFFHQFSKELIEILSRNLVKINNTLDDTQVQNTFHINSLQENELSDNLLSDWTISKACAYLLSIVARLSDSASLGRLLIFAETNFHSKDYLLRYAALLALCCSLDTAHKEIISNLLKCNFEAFFKTIADKVYLVSKTSSWLLCKISESYTYVIEKSMFSRYIPLFIRIIKEGGDDKFFNKINDDFYDDEDTVNYVTFSKEIRINLCSVLMNLIKFYGDKNTKKNSNPISSYCMGMLNDLILTAANERGDLIEKSSSLNKSEDKNININSSVNLSYFALQVCAKIIEYSSHDLQEKLEIILNTLTEFLENSNKNIISEKLNLNFQENICYILEQIYRKIIRRVKSDLTQKTFRAIIVSFVNRKDVYESGIFTIIAMSTNLKEEFVPMLSEYMEYVFYSLKNNNESNICKSGIIAITNIICLYNKSFIPYVDRTLPILFEILTDENIIRSAKLLAISAIGEICLNIPESIGGNIVGIMQILFSASEVALHAVNIKEEIDEDTKEYILQLKVALVEAFNSLIFGMREINQEHYLNIYLPNLLCYLKAFLSCTNPQIELMYSIICIIADIAQAYTMREVRKYIDQELLQAAINKIKTENNKIFMTNIAWAENILNVGAQRNII